MTDTDTKTAPSDQSDSTPRDRQATHVPRTGQVRSGLALILALLALLASGYIWYTVLYQNAELFSMDMVGALNRVESNSNLAQEALTNNESSIKILQETQGAIRASFEKISTNLASNRLEWALTETEQLLVIANNRLQLARDPHSSLAALRAADLQLQSLASPKLLPVRRELAREIMLLDTLDKADIGGITLRLATLADSIDRLPLALDLRLRDESNGDTPAKDDASQGAVAGSNWRQSARSLWRDILSLVRFRENIELQRPLLPPEHQYFLRENLRLMLYGAQQALLQGSLPVYTQNLKSAQRLLKDYFDVNSQSVVAMQTELGSLLNAKIVTDLPDISGALTTLRRLSGKRTEP